MRRKRRTAPFTPQLHRSLIRFYNIQLTSSYGKSEQALDAGFKSYFPKVLRSGKLSYSLTSLDGLFAACFKR